MAKLEGNCIAIKLIATMSLLTLPGLADAVELNAVEKLGKNIFF